mgnify:CR=1 FL=1
MQFRNEFHTFGAMFIMKFRRHFVGSTNNNKIIPLNELWIPCGLKKNSRLLVLCPYWGIDDILYLVPCNHLVLPMIPFKERVSDLVWKRVPDSWWFFPKAICKRFPRCWTIFLMKCRQHLEDNNHYKAIMILFRWLYFSVNF